MSRRSLVASIVLLTALVATVGVYMFRRAQDARVAEEARAAVAARAEREERRAARDRERVAAESRELRPPGVDGVVLAMTREALEKARPKTIPSRRAQDDDKTWLEETLANGAKVLYAFDGESERLLRMQILSAVPVGEGDVLQRHLEGLGERLGQPSGMYDCPDTGGAPTRQFVWGRRHVALRSVLLFYGDRVSITLDLAPIPLMQASLVNASCQPLTREDLADVPQADAAAIQRARKAAEGQAPPRRMRVPEPEPPPAFQ